jgi:hypothetical protein
MARVSAVNGLTISELIEYAEGTSNRAKIMQVDCDTSRSLIAGLAQACCMSQDSLAESDLCAQLQKCSGVVVSSSGLQCAKRLQALDHSHSILPHVSRGSREKGDKPILEVGFGPCPRNVAAAVAIALLGNRITER